MQSPQDHNTPIEPITHPPISSDDIDDFFEGVDTSSGEVLESTTVLGTKTSGKAHGTVEDLLKSLDTGEFHQLACCPFAAGPSPKGKGASVTVNNQRDKLTVTCWAVDEHKHAEEITRYASDGRTYAVWVYGTGTKREKDTVGSTDQSVLADYVLRQIANKEGLLAWRNETLYAYDKDGGKRVAGKSHANCSPTYGAWVPCPHDVLVETVRRVLAKTSVRGVDKAGNPTLAPIHVTVRLIGDVTTLVLRTLQTRERVYIARLRKHGVISYEEQEKATSRFDFCTATLLNPGTVLTSECKREIARPDHHVPADCRIGFAPDSRYAAEWQAYINHMIPDETDRLTFKMWVGAAIVGSCANKLQRHIVLKGKPGSGKSQLAELIGCLFPPAQRSAICIGDIHKHFTAVGLLGKRLNISGEADTEGNKFPDVGKIKLYLDGSPVELEQKNQKKFWAPLTCAHLMLANKLPAGDSGDAFFERFHLVRCTEQKMRGEKGAVVEWWKTRLHWKPAILAWAIEGLGLLKETGWLLPKSATSEEEKKDWQMESDSVLAWFLSLPPPPSIRADWTPAAAAYSAYASWCSANGYKFPLTSTKFGREIKDRLGEGGWDRSSSGMVYALSIRPADPVVAELFPSVADPHTLIVAAYSRGDLDTLVTLRDKHPAAYARFIAAQAVPQ